MSHGGMSSTGGKPLDPPMPERTKFLPKRGKVLEELRRRLESERRALEKSKSTWHGTQVSKKKTVMDVPRGERKPQKIRVWTLVFAGSLILMGAAIWGAYMLRVESFLPAPQGLLKTRIQMKGLELALRAYWAHYQRLPEGGMSNILAALSAADGGKQNVDRIIFMSLRYPEYRFGQIVDPGDVDEHGNYLDGWGRPFALEVDSETKSIRLRSPGPNGQDERGAGDDVEMLIVVDMQRDAR